jgi:hypothetical protein
LHTHLLSLTRAKASPISSFSRSEYRSLSSSLGTFLHSHVTSSLLGPVFSSAPYSPKPSVYVPSSVWATKFHTRTKQQAKLYFCIC